MSIVILDGMESEHGISNALKDRSEKRGEKYFHFNLREMNMLPCRSCGACAFKSPGKCVVQDDMHRILYEIAKCSKIILLTPIRFGGYSSCLKKAVDKFMSLCLPTYTVKKGHLLHPARYGNKSLIGIGIHEGDSKDQEQSFKKLVENNALNLQYPYKVLILKSYQELQEIQGRIDNILEEE